jgi:hypothetical protein
VIPDCACDNPAMGDVICSFVKRVEELGGGWYRFVKAPDATIRLGRCRHCGGFLRDEQPMTGQLSLIT